MLESTMKTFNLSLVTENQKTLEKGKAFANLVCKTLHCKSEFHITTYEKFTNSYRIEITGELEGSNCIATAIELTDRICSPWSVRYHREENTVELLFNKSDSSTYKLLQFNVLTWAHFSIEN